MNNCQTRLRIGFIPAGPAFDPDDIAGHFAAWNIRRLTRAHVTIA